MFDGVEDLRMFAFSNLCTGAKITMLKVKNVPTEAFTKNTIPNQKIWPLLMNRKNDSSMDTFQLHELNRPNAPRTRPYLRSGCSNERNNSGNYNNAESFHCAIGPILGLAQIFGLFPLSGTRSPSPLKLRFQKFSFLTVYATSAMIIILFMTIVSVIHMIKTLNAEAFEVQGGISAATAGAVFYGNSLLGAIIFFWMSPRWVILQRDWRAMEQYIDSNTSECPRLRWKFIAISSVVLLLALIEHILSMVTNTEGYEWHSSGNSSFRDYLEVYCNRSHAFILATLEYNFALGIYIFVVSKLATFVWNFTDVFIMLVSTGLAERYKSLNRKVLIMMTKHRSAIDWRGIREDYAILSSVVKKVDDDISPLILLSFANNLYFICLQLLNGLSRPPNSSTLSAVYFFGSFAFLIGRTCAVTLLTARINDQSKTALPYLYNCSTSAYNIEAERLLHQLTTDEIVLTGLRFFSITRNFMLAVAGAIVTYEVVLLQFNVAIQK